MKIKTLIKKIFLNFGLDIRFKKNRIKYLNLEDTKIINNNTLDYIVSLSEEEITKRIKSVTFSKPSNSDSLTDIRNMLKKEGIVIIPEVLDVNKIKESRNIIHEILKDVNNKNPSDIRHENENYIVCGKNIHGNSYYDLSDYTKPAIVVRQGSDQGMIDIFNVDKLLEALGETLNKLFSSEWLLNIINYTNEKINPKNLNLYVNNNITKTRGFHVDSYYRSIKAFIYLTDVNCLDDGPYCFVKGTHVDNPLKKLNMIIGNKEAPLINPLKIIPVFGKRGTLIISDQSGVHRGFPQSKGSLRELIVMRYA